MTRFTVNWDKAIEAIDFIALHKPGVTQYYIGKILFFADREHLLDYGRPITGDKYVAMEHGPVPSAIRDILKADSDSPDEILGNLHDRVVIEQEGNKQKVFSKGIEGLSALSGSDKEYLANAIDQYGSMSFAELKRVSHEDPAYADAWDKPGNANEMNIELWLNSLENPEVAKSQVSEYAHCGI
jgi:uncharacterized phage-associated protein